MYDIEFALSEFPENLSCIERQNVERTGFLLDFECPRMDTVN